MVVIALDRIVKVYGSGDTEVTALRDVSLQVESGDYVAIMGASGSGKSTMLNIIGCLDSPTDGSYRLNGIDVAGLESKGLARVRNRQLGIIFQSFNLIPRMSVLENVELPLTYSGAGQAERRERAMAALAKVGMADRVKHHPNQLSGGQQQRAAVARALVTEPALILADEPTGNLDSASTTDVLRLLDELNAAGHTIAVITHENDVAAHTKRLVTMVDGRIVQDQRLSQLAGPPPRLAAPVPATTGAP